MIYVFLTVICLLIFVYPYLIYPKILKLLPQVKISDGPCTQTPVPTIGLVFCAYNEEASLPSKIENIRQLKEMHPDLEVMAYSDLSDDKTFEILQSASDVLTPIEAVERLGKATGMKTLVAKMKSDVIVFTDANVLVDLSAIDKLKDYFRDPKIGTVAGRLLYVNDDEGATAAIGNSYWSLEESIKGLESTTGSTMGADGSIFATRRELYPYVPPHLLDDLTTSIEPLFVGFRVVSAPDVLAYERLTTDSGDEFRRKRRIACRAFNTHRYLRPKLKKMTAMNKFKYFSHKLIRWFGPGFLLLSSIFGILGLIEFIALIPSLILVALGLSVLYVGNKLEIGIVLKVSELLAAIVATGFGIYESLMGKTYQTWTPAESRNKD
jgi:cellulose synthase/poly-beta-1,6-N-acetylglucosamine synthase-like glycosyltransferase